MKKKLRLIQFAATVAAACALALSCASQPKVQEAPPQDLVVQAQKAESPAEKPKAQVPGPDAERAEAAALRTRAFELGAKEVLPEDYAAAEKAFAAGGASYGVDNAASALSFKDASSKYSALIDKALPLLSSSARDKAEKLRALASDKGAASSFAEQWALAEANLAPARAAEGSKDYEAAIHGYRAASKDYEALYKLCDAKAAREYIVARDLAKWASSQWTQAEAKYQAALELFPKDSASAIASVDEALLRYGLARSTALEYYAGDRKKASETERDRAAGIKTEVAVKDEYAQAAALYDKAQAAQDSKDYESSSALYDRAAGAFTTAYAHAKAKMDRAGSELDELDAAIASKEAAVGAGR
jgi:hypothetical protein